MNEEKATWREIEHTADLGIEVEAVKRITFKQANILIAEWVKEKELRSKMIERGAKNAFPVIDLTRLY